MVTKLDRLSRSASSGAKLVSRASRQRRNNRDIKHGRADNTPMGKLMITMLFAFAEFERDSIVERTMEGKAIARQKEGYREGRPPLEVPSSKISSKNKKRVR